jgi:hypothetical protein
MLGFRDYDYLNLRYFDRFFLAYTSSTEKEEFVEKTIYPDYDDPKA